MVAFLKKAPQNTVYFWRSIRRKWGYVFTLGYGYSDSLAGDCGERRLAAAKGMHLGREADGLCRGLCRQGEGERGILLTHPCR